VAALNRPPIIDPIEEVLVPVVIERAMSVFENFKDRSHIDVVQARKAVRDLGCNGS
jgi:hypothetical protein